MDNRFFASVLLFFFFLQIAVSQTHNSKNIYYQVQEMKGEFASESSSLFSPNTTAKLPSNSSQYVSKADFLQLDASLAEQIKRDKPEQLYLNIPFEGYTYSLQLYRKDVSTPSYRIKTSSGKSTKRTQSVFYRGIIKDDINSIVSLSVLSNSIRMTIATEEGNFEINKIQEDLYAAYRVSDSKHSQELGCSSDDLGIPDEVVVLEQASQKSFGDCIEVYIECDFDSYLENGSSIANTEDWALAIMNEVEILYDNEGIPMAVSEILVYDTSDPYAGAGGTGDMLNLMGSVIGNNYNGRLAHLFSTRNVGGGIAWVNVLCATNSGGSFGPYAVSGALSPNVVPFPIYSWNVMVVAHELGHNIGSSHTHACVWNGNGTQIDDCGPVAFSNVNTSCYDPSDPILPSSGTIMSYCHAVGGVGINFNNGFGDQPGALLLNKYNSANCSTGDECAFGGGGDDDTGTPPVADFTVTQFDACTPAQVQFTNQSFNDPESYEWFFPGGTPDFSTEEDPFVIYEEPGFYSVTLVATNSSGSDEWTQIDIVQVQEPPEPAFSFELIGNFISFTNETAEDVNSFFWDFGDGNVSAAENPLHEYINDGSYTVTLTVDSDCGVFEVSQVVDFFIPPTAGFNLDFSSGCNPLVVSYSNSSSSNTVDILWTFEGGIPETSTEENPIVTYATPGSYDVSLVATNANGQDELYESNLIEVEASPLAEFDFDINTQEVDFFNLSSGYSDVSWDFGDGNTSAEVSPSHSYAIGGEYEVTLFIESDNCGSAEISKLINVTGEPIASIDYDINEGCIGMVVSYSATNSTAADNYFWEFEGGIPATSTEENVIVEYPLAGDFDVQLTVSNSVGESTESLNEIIQVSDAPTAEFTLIQDDLTVELMAVTTMNTSDAMYSWDLGDGNTATGINPSHTYDEEGEYTIILYATSLCGENEMVQTISNYSLPVANINIDQAEGCADFTVSFTSSSENATEWSWSFPGGNPASSTEENPTVVYEAAGTYSVELSVTNPAGTDVLVLDDIILVEDIPVASYTSVRDMNTLTFTNTSTNADSYSWDFGDGNTSIEENPIHTYDTEGEYVVVLQAENACGLTEYLETIIVNNLPIAGYTANVTTGCIPLVVEFTDNSSSNVTEWNWTFPGGTPSTSTEASPTVTYNMTGEYDVSLVVSSSAGSDELVSTDLIITEDLPTASFQFVSVDEFDFEFSNTSLNADSYAWDFGDGNTSVIENPSHSFEGPGSYLVTLAASNACGTEVWEEEIIIEESTSVSGIDILDGIGIYPNPNQGEFVLSVQSSEATKAELRIFNVLGQSLMTKDLLFTAGKNDTSIQLENLSPGAYVLVLRIEDQMQVIKWMHD